MFAVSVFLKKGVFPCLQLNFSLAIGKEMEDLPKFTYHPDPVSTGAIEVSSATCPCCGKARGFSYALNPYCEDEIASLCPWCIADGSAAEEFDAEFVDACPLIEDGVPRDLIEEVSRRTPGFVSLQQEIWLSCCGDACEFHGDISRDELLSLPDSVLSRLKSEHELPDDILTRIREHYEPKGSPALYKFKCRQCGTISLGMDFD